MKNFKRLFSFVLAGVLVIAGSMCLTACGKDKTEQKTEKQEPVASVQVDVYTAGGQKSVLEDGTVLVLFDNVTLQWSEANAAVGRTSDGWWAGIKVYAPEENFVLDDAVYSGKADLSNPQSFKDNRDGDYYIGVWGLANDNFMTRPEFVERGYFEYNRYYDWNGDGTVDAHVILRICTNCTLAEV